MIDIIKSVAVAAVAVLFMISFTAAAQNISMTAGDCGEMEYYDTSMAMCMPQPMANMPMTMLMLRGNAFGAGIFESGPRGLTGFAAPNMFMADLGTTLGSHHYLNVELMGTAERWTFPDQGYPEVLQIGELNSKGLPYIDAQHPHSSPIMGLTFSDTISFGADGKDNVKIFFAPRGESTDGPLAFMHRPTGVVNPDAPLGHHIGQDVGHISSTVVGESLKLGATHLEFSTFHGAEPSPTNVDLPIGGLDSYAFRVIQDFTPGFTGMISYAYVSSPEPSEPDITFETRYSASIYNNTDLGSGWSFNNALIYGAVSNYDRAPTLSSVDEEFLLKGDRPRIWGRVEYLQRTPAELEIPVAGADPNLGRWVTAITLGYTHKIIAWTNDELDLGASVTNDILPDVFQSTYAGNPWTGKVFLQFTGSKMWEL